VGEAADPALVAGVRGIILADPDVRGLGAVLTMHLGPEDVLLNVEVQFAPGLRAEAMHTAVHRMEAAITGPYPEVKKIFIEVEALAAPGAAAPADASRAAPAQAGAPPTEDPM